MTARDERVVWIVPGRLQAATGDCCRDLGLMFVSEPFFLRAS
jgi:hypothetical protein